MKEYTFEETVSRLEELVKESEFGRRFSPGFQERLKKTQEAMVADIRKAETEESQEEIAATADEVAACLMAIQNTVLLRPVNEYMKELFDFYVLLASNWNQIVCDERIDQCTKAIVQFQDLTTNVAALIEVLKLNHERLGRLNRHPNFGFEISAHYLDTIEKRLEGHEN